MQATKARPDHRSPAPSLLLLFLIMTATATSSQAQEHQFYERGAVRESLTSIDAVNKANGNGIIDLPLGPVYSIGGDLDFQLRLFYNSKVWDTFTGLANYEMDRSFPVSFASRKSNAGVGWNLELGQLIPPRDGSAQATTSPLNFSGHWMYVAPDGSSHLFYRKLHENETTVPDVFYTRDGSYLRLKKRVGNLDKPHLIEFPDGRIHEFGLRDDSLGGTYRITRIYDAFGRSQNYMEFSYPSWDPSSGSGHFRDVEIRDSQTPPRTWSIHFDNWRSGEFPGLSDAAKTLWRLDQIEIPGVDGTTAVYDFHYSHDRHAPGCARIVDGNETGSADSYRYTFPFLRSISLPGQDPRPSYQIDYYSSTSTSFATCSQGALSKLTLPTGGTIHWTYDDQEIEGNCQGLSGVFLWNRTNAIVRREYHDIGGALLARWDYRYRPSVPPTGELEGAGKDQDCHASTTEEFASEVLGVEEINPLDDRIYTFHVIWPVAVTSHNGFSRYDYFDRIVKDNVRFSGLGLIDQEWSNSTGLLPQEAGGRFLSSVTYECGKRSDTGTCEIFSSEYIRMESEEPFDQAFSTGNPQVAEVDNRTSDRNQRVVSRLEKFCFQENDGSGGSVTHCNPKTTNLSDFDGLGHFRTQSQSGWNFNAARTVTTNYNPGVGTFTVDANHNPDGTFQLPSPSAPWILETYDRVETSDDFFNGTSRAAVVEFHFDPQDGALERQRILARTGSQRAPNDVLIAFGYDSGGNLIEEKRFGGDLQNNLPTSELSSIDPASLVPEYHKKYTVSQGIRTSEAWLRGGVEFLKNFESTVDFNTGLVRSTRDPAGVETTLKYDVLNRLTEIDKEGLAARVATYTPPQSGCNCSKITISQADRIEEVWKDGFGRNIRQRELFPNGKYSIQRFEYGSQGLLTRLSTVHYDGKFAGWTRFEDYDPRGRARRTVFPDDSRQTFNVQGEALFVTRRKVRTSATGEENVPHRIFKDYLGRIVKVEEHSGTGGARVATSYAYDIGDRLVQVSTPIPDQSPQLRTFTYDNRGFLSKEIHPEKAGNPVTHCRYDSLGNPGITVDGAQGACAGLALPSDASSLRLVYDAAARPTQVWDQASNRLMVENFYARTNRDNGSSKSRGKIYQTRRHNYPPSLGGEDLVVTETYDYSHVAGLMTEIRTRANRSLKGLDSGLSFIQMFQWDSLGNLEKYLTPVEQVDIYGLPIEQRVTDLTHRRGMLTHMSTTWRSFDEDPTKSARLQRSIGSVGSGALQGTVEKADLVAVSQRTDTVIESVTYHAHGAPNVVSLGNGVSETVTLPASRMARPGKIFTSGASENWSSGTFSYDGSGNVTAIGTNSFIYDKASRLVDATVSGNSRSYEYDRFGNLDRLGTKSLSVVPESNRLSGVTYDRRGNMTSASGASYQFDSMNMAVSADLPELGSSVEYVYGPDEERIAIASPEESSEVQWTLRDSSNLLGRDYVQQGRKLSAKVDYLHGVQGFVKFDYEENDLRYAHTDHLGSVRLLTDGAGNKIAGYDYMPYGEELPHPGNAVDEDQRLKFTGHERDTSKQDYMHARYYYHSLGRFSSLDVVLGSSEKPQSWNRYAYSLNNPKTLVDPNGNSPVVFAFLYKLFDRGADAAEVARASSKAEQMVGGVDQLQADLSDRRTLEEFFIEFLPEQHQDMAQDLSDGATLGALGVSYVYDFASAGVATSLGGSAFLVGGVFLTSYQVGAILESRMSSESRGEVQDDLELGILIYYRLTGEMSSEDVGDAIDHKKFGCGFGSLPGQRNPGCDPKEDNYWKVIISMPRSGSLGIFR